MEIRITNTGAKRKLASGAEQSFPVGWSGDVPDAVALEFIGEGKAEPVAGVASFTAEQAEFLRAFAQGTMDAIGAAAGGNGEDGDGEPDDGEDAADGDADPVLAGIPTEGDDDATPAAAPAPPPATARKPRTARR